MDEVVLCPRCEGSAFTLGTGGARCDHCRFFLTQNDALYVLANAYAKLSKGAVDIQGNPVVNETSEKE